MAVTSLLDTIFRRRKKKSNEFITTSFISIFEFDFDTIRAATHEFSDRIGHGVYSSVYKGKLQSGQEIAVKIFISATRQREFFRNEVEVLSKLKHKNLINLLGFCSKQDQHFLVYEFLPNSSLDRFIFDPCRASQLSWERSRNIIEGIARGLRYLHEESGLCVVHRDINPTNISLDSDLKPKITGFEMARPMRDGENEAESTNLSGTIGYIDPKYHQTLRYSVKSDVYSFGVTILTIITRRRDCDSLEDEPLIYHVRGCWNRGEAIDVIPQVMREEEREDSIGEILRYIHIALLCVDDSPETRPSLDKVLHWSSCFSTPLPETAIGNRYLAEEDTNWLFSPSPGHSSLMSPVSSR